MSARMENLYRGPGGYLYDKRTNERVIFYECDPTKNFLCRKVMCRGCAGGEDEGELGFCSSTPEECFRKEDGRAFYKRWNGEYYGREYIEEA